MVLNRETLNNGTFLNAFRDVPDLEWWSETRIEKSMKDMLKIHSWGNPLWIFAYGSLIYNPLFHFAEQQRAVLDGWHRSFCIRLILGRGSVEHPGRMLALERGGSTSGLAYRFHQDNLENELRLVWMREMVGGLYQPEWADVTLSNGQTVKAIIFAASTGHPLYERDSSPDTVISYLSVASGNLGSNRDYVFRLEDSLRHYGIVDEYIHDLAVQLVSTPITLIPREMPCSD
ncbi:gamma-glutamylcyclotransferase [Pectobacterium brasiliense]|uniref:gamma-glutamylcyclotransferase n=1 Tax=Pectobacterium brasiliense TaxID=180957 RepID=UPI0025A11398|nr:gamma-glutamylcyclotransferase [Pectobacterium brasiliense]WJM80394.1 gamma-glutamylcyclotransferase [Pectobacterium brasiliense]